MLAGQEGISRQDCPVVIPLSFFLAGSIAPATVTASKARSWIMCLFMHHPAELDSHTGNRYNRGEIRNGYISSEAFSTSFN